MDRHLYPGEVGADDDDCFGGVISTNGGERASSSLSISRVTGDHLLSANIRQSQVLQRPLLMTLQEPLALQARPAASKYIGDILPSASLTTTNSSATAAAAAAASLDLLDSHLFRTSSSTSDFIWDKLTSAQLGQILGEGCFYDTHQTHLASSFSARGGGGGSGGYGDDNDDGSEFGNKKSSESWNNAHLPGSLNTDLCDVLFNENGISAPINGVSNASSSSSCLFPVESFSSSGHLPTSGFVPSLSSSRPASCAAGLAVITAGEESLDSEGISLGSRQSEGSLAANDDFVLGARDPASEGEMIELGPWLASHLPSTASVCQICGLETEDLLSHLETHPRGEQHRALGSLLVSQNREPQDHRDIHRDIHPASHSTARLHHKNSNVLLPINGNLASFHQVTNPATLASLMETSQSNNNNNIIIINNNNVTSSLPQQPLSNHLTAQAAADDQTLNDLHDSSLPLAATTTTPSCPLGTVIPHLNLHHRPTSDDSSSNGSPGPGQQKSLEPASRKDRLSVVNHSGSSSSSSRSSQRANGHSTLLAQSIADSLERSIALSMSSSASASNDSSTSTRSPFGETWSSGTVSAPIDAFVVSRSSDANLASSSPNFAVSHSTSEPRHIQRVATAHHRGGVLESAVPHSSSRGSTPAAEPLEVDASKASGASSLVNIANGALTASTAIANGALTASTAITNGTLTASTAIANGALTASTAIAIVTEGSIRFYPNGLISGAPSISLVEDGGNALSLSAQLRLSSCSSSSQQLRVLDDALVMEHPTQISESTSIIPLTLLTADDGIARWNGSQVVTKPEVSLTDVPDGGSGAQELSLNGGTDHTQEMSQNGETNHEVLLNVATNHTMELPLNGATNQTQDWEPKSATNHTSDVPQNIENVHKLKTTLNGETVHAQEIPLNGQPVFPCPVCLIQYTEPKLVMHMAVHPVCQVCQLRFTSESHLFDHMNNDHEKCLDCGEFYLESKKISAKNSRKKYKITHSCKSSNGKSSKTSTTTSQITPQEQQQHPHYVSSPIDVGTNAVCTPEKSEIIAPSAIATNNDRLLSGEIASADKDTRQVSEAKTASANTSGITSGITSGTASGFQPNTATPRTPRISTIGNDKTSTTTISCAKTKTLNNNLNNLSTSKPVNCLFCTESFSSSIQFQQHMKENHKKCPKCTMVFHDKSSVSTHDCNPVTCRICMMVVQMNDLPKHEQRHPMCFFCQKRFPTEKQRQAHLSSTHVSCHGCKIYQKDEASLLEHYKCCTLVPCPICARLTPRENFEEHYRKHPCCEFCQQVLSSHKVLADHISDVHATCGQCKQHFANEEIRNKHAKTCRFEPCLICDKIIEIDKMDRHLVSHPSCDICHLTFTSTKMMKCHKREEHVDD